ncbi:flagellar biosynthesis protein FlgN [Shimia sp. SDUM112013]|uniref:flagellar biosynthesis protein FlgN n=1 Tax=Shimia sp. SDUM112013 TaxID=3136160 RepID=UPI0032EFB165
MDANPLTTLETILEKEKNALLNGHIGLLENLSHEKESVLKSLSFHDAGEPERVFALQQKMLRNQTLLESALAGIKAVSERLQTSRKVREALQTYDDHGRRLSVSVRTSGALERRA